jgi:nucleoside-diphosphate-sugar epimerase
MNVLLIGGAGFIGSRTAYQLLADGHSPVVFDSFDPQSHGEGGHVSELRKSLPVIEGDTRDADALDKCLREAEAIYYLEMVIANAAAGAGIPSVVFRYQNVFGPGQSLTNPYTGILSIFTQLLLGGQAINVFEDGLPTKDFVYVDDVVEYNRRALTAPLVGPVVLNVGTGVRKTLFDLVQALGNALAVETRHFVSGDFRLGDIRHAVADTESLFRILGSMDFTLLEAGVRAFTAWVTSQRLSGHANASFQKSLEEMREAGLLRTAQGS